MIGLNREGNPDGRVGRRLRNVRMLRERLNLDTQRSRLID